MSADRPLPQSLGVVDSAPIGEGGMAYIYKAKQPGLGRDVAVKRIKPELIGHPTILKRFEREAKASSRLLHQNLAHVYDYVVIDNFPCIVMEYVEGVDVADMLARRGTVPINVSCAIMLGVSRALGYIHSFGLIHRDMKPENIRVSSRGEVKLMDFGIALQAEDAKLTLPGIIIGSPQYLSPEQILGERIDHRSDLFSLGICFYELVTGTRPFDSTDQATVFQNIRGGKFRSARKANPKIPRKVDSIIKRLLQVNPEKRYQSALEVYEDIKEVLGFDDEKHFLRQYLVFEAFVTPRPEEGVAPPSLPKKRGWVALAMAAFIGLGVGVSGSTWYLSDSVPSPTMETEKPELSWICPLGFWETRMISEQNRNHLIQIFLSFGVATRSIPAFDTLKLNSSNLKEHIDTFNKLSPQQRAITLAINQAKSGNQLFERASIQWPRLAPCR